MFDFISFIINLFYNRIWDTINCIVVILCLLISIGYLTLAERKTLSYMQQRKGPNVVGVYGILQPLADGAKLFTNEAVIPNNINLALYLIAPVFSFILSLVV